MWESDHECNWCAGILWLRRSRRRRRRRVRLLRRSWRRFIHWPEVVESVVLLKALVIASCKNVAFSFCNIICPVCAGLTFDGFSRAIVVAFLQRRCVTSIMPQTFLDGCGCPTSCVHFVSSESSVQILLYGLSLEQRRYGHPPSSNVFSHIRAYWV